VELDSDCCKTLRLNRPNWIIHEEDLNTFNGKPYKGIDLLAGGLPCPPFSIAGKQLGKDDERNLFPAAIRLVDETRPKAIMIENVRGFLDAVFEDYRGYIKGELKKLGYETHWRLLSASDYGVPQLRPRVVIIALRDDIKDGFDWPIPNPDDAPTVGESLVDLMAVRGWRGARKWANGADDIAPTLVGGSKKLISLIGIVTCEKLEAQVPVAIYTKFTAQLQSLKVARDSLAHTYLKGSAATMTIDAPSVTKARFADIHDGLKAYEQGLRVV
jgi:DNA (cytosine-5)-methyltransferase 1